MTDRATLSKLRDLATEALSRGRFDQALKCYLELERLDKDPDWSRRAAGVYKRLNRPREEIDALSRASREYARRGDTMKALATSKQILAIDPRHAETLRRLPELRSAFETSTSRDFSSRSAPSYDQLGSTLDDEMQIERTSEPKIAKAPLPPPPFPVPPAGGLMNMALREVVPGAAKAARAEASEGIYEIPLEDEVRDDEELALSFEEPLHVSMARERGQVSIDKDGNVTSGASEAAEAAEDLAIAAVEEEFRAAEKANKALSKAPLFAELPKKVFSELLLNARLVELEDKQELFKQGDTGDALYVIAEGRVGVVDEGPPRRGIAKLEEGDYFGEIALVTDQPRTATIVALADALLIAIDREIVRKVIATDPSFLTALLRLLRNRLVDKLLATNPLFVSLSPRDRDALKPRFRFLEVEPGAMLLTDGKRPEGLMIILAGHAEVYRVQNGRELKLGELKSGDVCGETALLTGRASFANVRSKSKCLAIELPAVAFDKIVRARPEALAFIKQVMDQRVAKSEAILSGKASYTEGRLRV